ncbi:hypothetical protein ATX60_03985 [Oenococcus oeni]|nr:hypothetical protein ATX60_03985 [Oenococcus oeni]
MWLLIIAIFILFLYWFNKHAHRTNTASFEKNDQISVSKVADSKELNEVKTEPSSQPKPVKIVETVENKMKEPEIVQKEITHFKVSGVTKHELRKAVSFARKEYLIDDPYDGYTTKEIKDAFNDMQLDGSDKIFETDLDGVVDKIDFIPEPDNKFDDNAIKIMITIEDQEFFIGYVPAYMSERMSHVFDTFKKNGEKIDYNYKLTGGKYKTVDYDPDDGDYTRETPKLKVSTQTESYGFNIRLYEFVSSKQQA